MHNSVLRTSIAPEKICFIYADDDPDDQTFLLEACNSSHLKFEVKQLYNGIELVRYLSAPDVPHYDFIVIDINMPVMDGLTAAQLLKDSLKLQWPIYVLSTSKDPSMRQRATAAGITGYFVKPIVLGELRSMIEQIALDCAQVKKAGSNP